MKSKECFTIEAPGGWLIPFYTASYAKQSRQRIEENLSLPWEKIKGRGYRVVKCELKPVKPKAKLKLVK